MKFDHKCGVFGIMHHPQSWYMTHLGIFALQHRGQEGAGIFGYPDLKQDPYLEKGCGLVDDVFVQTRAQPPSLCFAIGHVRYSTSGKKQDHLDMFHPIVCMHGGERFALCHNGNIPLTKMDSDCATDSNQLLKWIVHVYDAKQPLASVKSVLANMEGAYSFLLMTPQGLIYARDPWGFRPLVLGYVEGAPVVCSETCALDLVGAKYVRDIAPGEIGFIPFHENTLKWDTIPKSVVQHQQCIFELIYFSRPDSVVFGQNVYEVRKTLGKLLAKDFSVEADVVMAVPDSGVPASLGYAQALGIPWEVGIIRNHYIHRTFIQPTLHMRHLGVKIKHNPIRDVVANKRVVLVDDSIVRSTTSRNLVALLRSMGAKSVAFAVSSPPIRWPCFYGIDTPTRKELIAAHYSVDQIRDSIGADHLGYLTQETLMSHFGKTFCYACFSGQYHVAREATADLLQVIPGVSVASDPGPTVT